MASLLDSIEREFLVRLFEDHVEELFPFIIVLLHESYTLTQISVRRLDEGPNAKPLLSIDADLKLFLNEALLSQQSRDAITSYFKDNGYQVK